MNSIHYHAKQQYTWLHGSGILCLIKLVAIQNSYTCTCHKNNFCTTKQRKGSEKKKKQETIGHLTEKELWEGEMLQFLSKKHKFLNVLVLLISKKHKFLNPFLVGVENDPPLCLHQVSASTRPNCHPYQPSFFFFLFEVHQPDFWWYDFTLRIHSLQRHSEVFLKSQKFI